MIQHPVFRFFGSLKFAVVLILSLAFVLAVATGIESVYGMRAVKTLVYGTPWFAGLLFLLVVCLSAAALSRFPWKRHQIGFVLTHLGIITLLLGAGLTSLFGVDGNLPVTEGTHNNEVILSDLVLEISEEEKRLDQIRLPEFATKQEGSLYTVGLGDGRLVMNRFFPRAVVQREVTESPLKSVGRPAIRLTLENDRFSLSEWLTHMEPEKASELNLGPAVVSLDLLRNNSAKERFAGGLDAPTRSGPGMILVDVEGRSYRLPIAEASKGWTRVNDELSLIVDRYLPYAIVEKNRLVSKSNEPRNPAVTLRVKSATGAEEKHTIFALFPEFATHHRGKNTSPSLGVKLRMLVEGMPGEGARGYLRFAQSLDGTELFYRSLTRSTGSSQFGKVTVGEFYPTGWMDLKFRVDRWLAHSVSENVPHYVDKISGSDGNYVAAAHFSFSAPGQVPEEFWLVEGMGRALPFVEPLVSASLKRKSFGLPFQVQLDKFTIRHDPGTQKAASYESQVTVKGAGGNRSALISMNEPLEYGGYTFYQASYQLNENGPPLSVFSVNLDPGRWVKYGGSILLTVGILLMFYMNPHYWNILLGSHKERQ